MDCKEIAKEVKTLANLLKRRLDNAITKASDENITSVQVLILGYLDETKADVYQKDIEKQFDIRRSTVTNILHGMEKQELIERQTVNNDARLKKIILTSKAKDILSVLNEEVTKIQSILIKDIPEKDLEIYFSVIKKMKENLGGKQ
ncbi:MAG: MarR family transcriptional regulator [Clostridiales bacterium]|nr:MarR family transcriptional regulator [Clostridiales bacterium]